MRKKLKFNRLDKLVTYLFYCYIFPKYVRVLEKCNCPITDDEKSNVCDMCEEIIFSK